MARKIKLPAPFKHVDPSGEYNFVIVGAYLNIKNERRCLIWFPKDRIWAAHVIPFNPKQRVPMYPVSWLEILLETGDSKHQILQELTGQQSKVSTYDFFRRRINRVPRP